MNDLKQLEQDILRLKNRTRIKRKEHELINNLIPNGYVEKPLDKLFEDRLTELTEEIKNLLKELEAKEKEYRTL